MAAFRKIVVNNKEYGWKYSFDDYDYQCDSLLIIKDSCGKGKIIVRFHKDNREMGYCPFNKGLKAVYENKEVIINLNEPRFISEILNYILDNRIKGSGIDGTIEIDDGIFILQDIGYKFDYHLEWPTVDKK